MVDSTNILCIGDLVGEVGVQRVCSELPELREKLALDIVIANVENAWHGKGVTSIQLDALQNAGVDIFTSGNHIWHGGETQSPEIWNNYPLLRPANYTTPGLPGNGDSVFSVGGKDIRVINLLGTTLSGPTQPLLSPFHYLMPLIHETRAPSLTLIDFHTEATSEKISLAYMVDGFASAVVGTHTHVPTADPRILPKGTAFVTDLGMVGLSNSVLGVDSATALASFTHPFPLKFSWPTAGPSVFQSVLISLTSSGKPMSIQRVDR